MKDIAKISKHWVVFIVLSAAFFTSCEKYSYQVEVVDPVVPVLFQTEIQPIFTANCITCHRGSRAPDLRDGNSYKSLTEGGFVTQPAESSELYTIFESASHTSRALPAEKQKILIWIQQGALNN